MSMGLNEYQAESRKTAMYKGINTFDGVVYNSLKLAGEAGEIADKIGKMVGNNITPTLTPEQILDLSKEAGDVLWHLTNLCLDLGVTLEWVAQLNIDKLSSRQKRGILMSGDGDNR